MAAEYLRGLNPGRKRHDKDERWADVDNWACKHLFPPQSHLHEHITYALQLAESRDLPDVSVSLLQGKFLMTQIQMVDAKNILEVGTLGGVSMASAGSDVKITTIEINEDHKQVAEEAIARASLSDRIEVIHGSGVDILPKLRAEVESGKRPKYDFVFIDADKENNLNYYNEAIGMCRSRACITVDNVVRQGRVADDKAAEEDERVMGARKVIAVAGKDQRLMGNSLIQTVGEKDYDGFLVCIVK